MLFTSFTLLSTILSVKDLIINSKQIINSKDLIINSDGLFKGRQETILILMQA